MICTDVNRHNIIRVQKMCGVKRKILFFYFRETRRAEENGISFLEENARDVVLQNICCRAVRFVSNRSLSKRNTVQ
jgi:hypothetical protein